MDIFTALMVPLDESLSEVQWDWVEDFPIPRRIVRYTRESVVMLWVQPGAIGESDGTEPGVIEANRFRIAHEIPNG